MKKTKQFLFMVVLIISAIVSKAQTCTSPINLTVDGSCSGTDSTNSVRYFKFTATQDYIKLKIHIKNYNSGYYGVKLYNNDCSNLAANEISISPVVSGDSLDIANMLSKGNDYLIELTRINPAGNYLVYNVCAKSYGVDYSLFAYTCSPTMTSCTSSSTCELVCNGSFECLSVGISTLGQVSSATNWGSATLGTPDLFSQVSSTYPNASVTCNYFGNEPAKTGNNYAGIILENIGYSEYLKTKLKSPLQVGKKYIITFYISRGENSFKKIENLSVYSTSISTVEGTFGGLPPTGYTQIGVTSNTAILNATTWQQISFCYSPTNSNEDYLVIGQAPTCASCTPQTNSVITTTCGTPAPEPLAGPNEYGYLYFDDFSVQQFTVDAGVNVNICPGLSTILTPSFACNTVPNVSLTYSWTPSTGLSSTTSFTTVAAPTATTNYTLTVSASTSSTGCSVSDNVIVNVYPSSYVPPTPTITASSPTACIGSIISYTASGGAGVGTYTWYPGGVASTTFTYGPIGGPQTVTLVTGSTCTSQAVYTLGFPFDLPCGCIEGCQTSLSGSIGSQNTNSVYCVIADATISGATTFTNSDFRIAPGVKITVPNSSTLTILGCHLFSCGDMWQGIVVEPGGVLKIGTSSSGLTTMIEDAYIAVDVQTYTLGTSATSILTATNVIFNRNDLSIKLNDYNFNQTTYPYSISNNLFTSRTITYTTLSWPTTTTVKNSTTTPSSVLQTPYLNNTLYPAQSLKSPMSSNYPAVGVELNSVGYTTVTSSPTFKGAVIGITGATTYNVFDNLRIGINANNSNLTVVNSIFQSGARYGHGNSAGGRGIVAVSTQLTYSTSPAINNQLKVTPASGTSYSNKFYELTRGVDVTGYLHTELTYNEVYSYANAYTSYSTINAYGGLGFRLSTNRYHTMKVENNKIYNIKNCVTFDITTGDVIVGSKVGYGRYCGSANFNNNKISRHPSTPSSTDYVNIGISFNDAYAAASTSLATVGGSGFYVNTNTITTVHNGVGIYNLAYTPVVITSNSVTMVEEPNTIYSLPAQAGIKSSQLNNISIHQNIVSGPTTFTTDMRAITTSMNSILSVKCNTTSNTVRGLDFNASQPSTTVEDNTMQNQTYGFSMDNNGVTGTLGTATNPTNNQWLSSWTGLSKTFNYDNNSSAQNSKIYVQWGSATLDPNGSSFTNGTYNFDDYFHNAIGPNTLLNVTTTLTPSCRLSGGGGGGGRMMASGISIDLMEDLVQDKISYTDNIPETRFIDKNRVFRLLNADDSFKSESTVLNSFYSNCKTSVMQTLFDIEMNLLNGDKITAKSNINGLSSVGIEGNYKEFYTLLLNDSLSAKDSLTLITLANSCPYTQGGVVYQARALYNQKFNVYLSYKDNCQKTSAKRLASDKKDEINVILNSKLYPNPNSGEFNIEIIGKQKGSAEVSILDVT